MPSQGNCRIGHEKLNITISILPNEDGSAAIKSELVLGGRGSIETLGYKVVSARRIEHELEAFIGKAWNWFDVTGIRLSDDVMLRSSESVVAMLKKVRPS
jgi:hypothetical protein